MEKDTKNKIEFMVVCISEFARRYKLTLQQAFRYLNNWKGLAFLEEFYDVEHLLSIEPDRGLQKKRGNAGMKLYHGSNTSIERID